MLGSNPNIPSIYPSLLSLIFVSRPLYYSTTTTAPLPDITPWTVQRQSSECVGARASCWSVSEPFRGEEQVKIKGVENWGKNMERGWILANRANARASFNNSNEPITRSRCKSARVDLVRGGLRDVERSVFKPSSAPLSRLYLRLWCTSTFACAYTWLFLYMRRVTLHYVVIVEFEDN